MSGFPSLSLSLSEPSALLVEGLLLAGLAAWIVGRLFSPSPARSNYRPPAYGNDAVSLVRWALRTGNDAQLLQLARAQTRSRIAWARGTRALPMDEVRALRQLDRRLGRMRWAAAARGVRRRLARRLGGAEAPAESRLRPNVERILHVIDLALHGESP